MRRHLALFILLAGVCFVTTPQSFAQQTESQKLAQTDEESDLFKWKMINTGIFALILGFGIIKFAPKFFSSRSLDIQKAIKEATGLKIEADFRYSAVDKKMSNLTAEVERMKADAAAEMEREHKRMQAETAADVEHIAKSVDYEIDSLRAEGARLVKAHTSELAFGLAERRLQQHFAQNDSQNNIAEFVNLVGSANNGGGKK